MFRKKRIIWGLMLIPLIWGLGYALPPQGWDSPQRYHTVVAQQYPGLAASGKYVYQGFLSGIQGSYELCFRRSTNAGFHWEDVVQVSQAASHEAYVPENQFDIAPSSDGSLVYLVWTEIDNSDTDTSLWFSYSTDHGVTWIGLERIDDANDLNLPSSAIKKFYPAIHCDITDTLRLAFYYRYHDGISIQSRLCYSQFNHQALPQWHTYENVSADVYDLSQFDITTLTSMPPNPPIPHIVFNKWVSKMEQIWHTYRDDTGWHENLALYLANTRQIRLQHDGFNTLNLAFIRKYSLPPTTKLFYSYSTDAGQSWLDPPELVGPQYYNSRDCDLAVDQDGIHFNYALLDGGIVWYRHKTAPTGTWDDEIIIAQHSDSLCYSPAITSSGYGRHVSFHTVPSQGGGTGANTFIHYLANLDALYSGSGEATAYNWGRHLVRQPSSEKLYVCYQTDFEPNEGGQHNRNWIYFASSTDGGDVWSPYTWLSYGKHPTIGQWSSVEAPIPIPMAYFNEDGNTIFYRYYEPSSDDWSDPLQVYTSANNIDHPPAITAVSDSIFVLFKEHQPEPGGGEHWIKCAKFRFDETNPQNVAVEIVEHDYGLLFLYEPSAMFQDGNGDLHATWRLSNETIRYARRKWGAVPPEPIWRDYFDVISTLPLNKEPHIDVWGDDVYIVWKRFYTYPPETFREIYRRIKDIPNNVWADTQRISYTGDANSSNPTASSEFIVWSEPPIQTKYDIYYYSDNHGSGWFWQSSEKSRYPHSTIRPDLFGVWLYIAWTEGNQSPYQIISNKQFFSIMDGKGFEWYSVEVGNSEPSPFLVQREGIKEYGNHKIDFDTKGLIYELTFLDPIYNYYLIAKSYHEGTPRKEIWQIDGEKVGEFAFQSNKPETVMIKIPYKSYLRDRKVKFTFKNASGSFAAKSGLKLVCIDREKRGGGGGQSGGFQIPIASKLRITPNPTNGILKLNFSIENPLLVKISLCDISGRRVSNIHNDNLSSGDHKVSTYISEKLSSGVYFLILETERECITKKVILQR